MNPHDIAEFPPTHIGIDAAINGIDRYVQYVHNVEENRYQRDVRYSEGWFRLREILEARGYHFTTTGYAPSDLYIVSGEKIVAELWFDVSRMNIRYDLYIEVRTGVSDYKAFGISDIRDITFNLSENAYRILSLISEGECSIKRIQRDELRAMIEEESRNPLS